MAIFLMAIGLPGSGKSSLKPINIEGYLYEKEFVHLSSDNIREELYGNASIQGDPKIIFEQMQSRAVAHLKVGNNVYYDATNISRKFRMDTLKLIKEKVPSAKRHGILFLKSLENCFKDDAKRERMAGTDIILSMAKKFNFPLLTEGFDHLSYFSSEPQHSFAFKEYESPLELSKDLFERFLGIDAESIVSYKQNSPYHSLTLGEHIFAAFKKQNEDDLIVRLSAALHDIGKPYCRMEKEGRSVYYGHENVSAYIASVIVAQMKPEGVLMEEDLMLIPELVEFHMVSHQIFQPPFAKKAKEKIKNLIGEEQFERLYELHKRDKGAK